MSRQITLITLLTLTVSTSGCIAPMSGQTKDSGDIQMPESAGAIFAGPQYTIGIVKFDNKVPAKVSGAGDAAATILRTQLEAAGLNTILLDANALKEEDKSTAFARTGSAKNGQQLDNGIDSADFRLSGAITAYSEVEEGIDANTFQKRSVVARTSVEYALTDIVTGKPLLTESGTGTYRKDITGSPGLGGQSTYDPNIRDDVLRDTLAKAVDKIVQKLNALPFQGRLLSVDGQTVLLRAGSRAQLKEGTQLVVFHVSDVLRDPVSGQIFGYKDSKIGVIKINRNTDENISEASILSGGGFQTGDIARYIP
jgi:hypothetical protein